VNVEALDEFVRLYPLDYRQLPFEQFLSLLWSSYQVGMVWPGAQALYTSFDFRYRESRSDTTLYLDELQHRFDDRFNMATISASSSSCKLKMTAFFRPRPVEYSMQAIEAEIAMDSSLAGKRVLVLGASRGFGSVLSRAFILKGAQVALNYRTEGKEVNTLKSELSDRESNVWFLRGDISQQADCEALRESVAEHLGGLDYLVCNASPQIMAYPFAEMTTEEFSRFVNQSISVCHRPISVLLPLLEKSATVINISSIYATEPPKNFSHYVTAKWSLEGMTHALASEYPELNFVVARLPRMLTDQTNSNFDFEPKASAIKVASTLLDRLVSSTATDNPGIINFASET
jgi:3-oxoacyl-[acyl-carrier protein] reductase